MTPIHPQFVVDENKVPQAIVIPIDEWERIVEELEELDDIRAFDEAKSQQDEFVPLDQALREIDEEIKPARRRKRRKP